PRALLRALTHPWVFFAPDRLSHASERAARQRLATPVASRDHRELRTGDARGQAPVEEVDECVDKPGIPLRPSTLTEAAESLILAEARAIWPIAHHRVPGIGDRADARTQRSVLSP